MFDAAQIESALYQRRPQTMPRHRQGAHRQAHAGCQLFLRAFSCPDEAAGQHGCRNPTARVHDRKDPTPTSSMQHAASRIRSLGIEQHRTRMVLGDLTLNRERSNVAVKSQAASRILPTALQAGFHP